MSNRPILFWETEKFTKLFDTLATEKERASLYQYLSQSPLAGDVIQGSGGVRKLRWKRPGMGKRGGMRVIYYYFDRHGILSLLLAYAKSEKEDLKPKEIDIMRDLVETIRATIERGNDD